MILLGTRPEAIKMIPVIKSLRKFPDWFEVRVILTGQHKEQLKQVMDHFHMKEDLNLQLMELNQTLSTFTSRAINKLSELLKQENPDLLLVHGDTQTSLSGALTAYFNQISLGHVEAGLRSYDKYSPWPEEMNRKLVDVLADLMFAPTSNNMENLLKEGCIPTRIFVTGQTGIDAAVNTYKDEYHFLNEDLNKLDFLKSKIVTVTVHRRESIGNPMRNIFQAIRELVDSYDDLIFIYPVHLNPKVQRIAFDMLTGHDRINLIDPLAYSDMINLLARCNFIISDSGGLQEESATFFTPLILTRNTTERPEAIHAGTTFLTGTVTNHIVTTADKLINNSDVMKKFDNPFGDGKAAERIAQAIAFYFGLNQSPPDEFKIKS